MRLLLSLVVVGMLCACGAQEAGQLPTLVVIENNPVPTAKPPGNLDFWQPINGSLSPDTPLESWIFTGQAEDNITIRAIGQGVELSLTLFDPSGDELLAGEPIQTQLPTSGDYLVTVRLVGNGSGSYQLGLAYTDRPNPLDTTPTSLPIVVGVPTPLPIVADLGTFISEISSKETLAGLLTTDDNQHVYTFQGHTGEYATIEMTRVSGRLNPLLTLYDPTGTPLAVDANSGSDDMALLRNVRLNQDGFYTVQASGRGAGGAYSIKFTGSEDPQPVTATVVFAPTATLSIPPLTPVIADAVAGARLENHIPVKGVLERAGDVQRHSFTAGEGEIITLGVVPAADSPLIPHVELYDPEGIPVEVASGNESPSNRQVLIPLFVAQESGPYTAFITGEGETFGAYIISYGIGSTYQDMMRGEAKVDAGNTAQFEASGLRDSWYVNLNQGDVITAAVTVNEGVLDPVLELVAENGDLLGIDNNSGGERSPLINGVTIPRTGLYFFRIRAALTGQSGSYTLVWRYINVAPTATPPQGTVSVLSVDDTVKDSAYNFYPFQAHAGQQVRISVIAEFGSPFDPVVAVLDPSAEVIAEGDDFEGGLNPVVYVTIPADGTYTVRVNGYQQGGNFEVLVEALVPVN